MGPFLIILVIIAALAFVVIGMYNSLVKLRNKLQESWRQIDVELNRRYDLIPNLVEVVKGYSGYEAATLERVVALRNQARQLGSTGASTEQRANAEAELGQAVTSIFVTAEAYPDLKANQNFLQLQTELSATEDRIANARRYYNAIVGDYNTKTESFPSNLISGMFGFSKAGYFEASDPQMRIAPTLDMSGIGQAPAAGPAIGTGTEIQHPVQATPPAATAQPEATQVPAQPAAEQVQPPAQQQQAPDEGWTPPPVA